MRRHAGVVASHSFVRLKRASATRPGPDVLRANVGVIPYLSPANELDPFVLRELVSGSSGDIVMVLQSCSRRWSQKARQEREENHPTHTPHTDGNRQTARRDPANSLRSPSYPRRSTDLSPW